MFYYIEGTVSVIEQGIAVIDTGGIGFLCNVSMNTMSRIELNKKAKLYTYCNIKEDAFDIYGFYDLQEKHCFELLLSVSGVGPKAALSILSSATPEDLALSVATENEKLLTAAPGVGKRIAQRIILELKDKIAKTIAVPADAGLPTATTSGGSKKLAEITAALEVLGFTGSEITVSLKGIDIDNSSVEDVIRAVLQKS